MPAWAHMSSPGAEGFVRGIGHPVFEPLQGLCAGAFGVLIGRAKRQDALRAWQTVLVAAFIGLAGLLFLLVGQGVPNLVLLSVAAVTALTVAALPRPPRLFLVGLAAINGLVLGANAVSTGMEGQIATSAGALLGALMGMVYLAGATLWLKEQEQRWPWLVFVPRVAAAWVVAIAVMLAAFELRPALAGLSAAP